jgi:maleylacetoacetate isomerase
MSLYPTIDRVNKALLELPEVQAACPGKQPDCPPELKDEAANKTGSS